MTYDEIALFVKDQIATNAVIDEEADTVTMDGNGIDHVAEAVAERFTMRPKIKRFLFVEDGSVDIDELQTMIDYKNREICLVVYRQGADRPQLVEVKD